MIGSQHQSEPIVGGSASEGSVNGSAEVSHSKQHAPLPDLGTQIKSIFFGNWLNLLLVFVPVGIGLGAAKSSANAIFITNFLAIIPLAKLLGMGTEEIALKTNETLGGLLNATFGNAVELILSIIALKAKLVRVVQASLLGSILSNQLFVLGFCFLFGGFYYKEQSFNQVAAQTSSSMMALSVLSLLIPAQFIASTNRDDLVLELSHGTAMILLAVYICYLVFQLKTHSHLFQDAAKDDEEEEESTLSLPVALILLTVSTVFVSVCAEFLVDSLEEVATDWKLSGTFIGLVLLPIVGNAAEHLTAVTSAVKNKMNLAIGVAIGSSMQIALFVTPFLVIVSWIMDVQLTLYFQQFETSILAISVLVVNYMIQDGQSNWLEGAMLMATYIIIAMAFYFLPSESIHD